MKRIRLFENFDQKPGVSSDPSVTEDVTKDWPDDIKSPRDAEQLLLALAKAGLIYHFDDTPSDVYDGNKPTFTPEQATRLETLMDKVFDVCEPIGGFWEGLIRNVFMGYIAFTADQEPITADIYIVKDNGPDVRKTTYTDYVEMQQKYYDEESGYDEAKVDAWFNGLKKA